MSEAHEFQASSAFWQGRSCDGRGPAIYGRHRNLLTYRLLWADKPFCSEIPEICCPVQAGSNLYRLWFVEFFPLLYLSIYTDETD